MKRALVAVIVIALAAGAIVFVIKSKMLAIRGEDVTIESGGEKLAATLAIPRRGRGPFPAAVVVHGSGRVTRRDLREWGGRFTPAGMVILMYDKRGTGESTGDFSGFRAADCFRLHNELANDVAAAVEYLRTRDDIDAGRIGLIGGSQAGWVMPLAASRTSDVSFIVVLAGPAVTCGQLAYYQQLTGVQRAAVTDTSLTFDELHERLHGFDGLHGYDPMPVLEGLTVPSLWILGGRDRNVPTRLTVENIEKIRTSGNRSFTVEVYPEADHNLRDAAGGLIDPWNDIYAWLADRGIVGSAGGGER